MKILSIQSYNHTSKVNSQSNKKGLQNASPVNFRAKALKTAEKLALHFRLIKMSVESRFINRQGNIRTGFLTGPEEDILQGLYHYCNNAIEKEGVPYKNGNLVLEMDSGEVIKGKIESGSVSNIDGADYLLGQIPEPENIKDGILYTILPQNFEEKGNFYRVLFDENGAPKVMAYMNKEGDIIRAFVPKILGA